MIINQEKIQRMIGGGASGNGSGSGIGGSDLVGYATQAWVNENYLSIEFFSSLFKAYDSSANPNEIAPNDGDTTAITNIKAMFGFWTDQYLSALGLNSAGGGGGATSLVDLLDVNITSPTNGQALVYNATSGKWENQTIGGGSTGTLSSIGLVMPTGFSVSPGTLTEDGSFTVSFAAGYGLPLTADVNKGVTAYGWGNHANAGYLTSVDFSDLTSHPTTLAGYGITDAKIASGAITLGSNTITPWTTNNHPSTIAGYGINNAYISNGSIVLGTNTITPWTNSNHPSTLAGYGITDAMLIKSLTTTDSIDTLYDAGSYRFAATAQGTWPTGVTANYGQMLVVHGGGDTVAQIFFPYNSSAAYLRNGNPVNSGSWNGWKQLVTPDMNVASATKLETSRTLWGQSFNGTANVSGNMNSVGSITMSGSITMDNNTAIRMKDNSDNTVSLLHMDTGGNFVIGETADIYGHNTYLRGANFIFQQGTTSANRKELFRIDSTGNLHMKQYNTHLSMRSSANAEYNVLTLNTDPNASQSIWHLALGYGTAGVDYGTRIFGGATTGIKFLCGQTTEVASIYKDSSRQGIKIGDALLSWDSTNNALKVTKYDGTAINMYSLGGLSALGVWTGSNGEITVTGVTATGNVQGANVIATTKVTSPKFYFDSTRYLELYTFSPASGVTVRQLRFYDGENYKVVKFE